MNDSILGNDMDSMPAGDNRKQTSLILLIILLIIVFLLQTGMREFMKWLAPEGNFLKLMIITQQVLTIFLPVVLFLIILHLPAKHSLGLYPPPWLKTIIAVILGFVLIIAVNMVLPMILQPSQQLTESTRSITAHRNFPEFLLTLFTVSIIAAIADELFFRGVVLRSLIKRYGKIVAIVVTAILTALFHTLEPFKLAHAFLMGLIFATAVVWTNSVYTSIILHSLHNSLALIPQG